MCRCCQSCLEDLYWNCIEEKFCYDESIANYDETQEDGYHVTDNRRSISTNLIDNNNLPIVINQPTRNNNGHLLSSKIHEEDYRREIQTSVPILAPEILSTFENSQIFQDTTTKQKSFIKAISPGPGVHGVKEFHQDELLKRLETPTDHRNDDRKIKFSIEGPDSPSELKTATSPFHHFEPIAEEQTTTKDELLLRAPTNEFIARHSSDHKLLRHVQSVPHFNPSRIASENDIFMISGSLTRISMTPEIPSISYSSLPKHYADTPTIEKYRESVSLYSIQTANIAKATQLDLTMPRYGKSGGGSQSSETLTYHNKNEAPKKVERSKRLKTLRESLPPLRIHSIKKKNGK